MTTAARELLEQALRLSEDDRLLLVEGLLESIPLESPEELDRAWVETALRRAEALERGEMRTLDGLAVLNEIEARLRGQHGP